MGLDGGVFHDLCLHVSVVWDVGSVRRVAAEGAAPRCGDSVALGRERSAYGSVGEKRKPAIAIAADDGAGGGVGFHCLCLSCVELSCFVVCHLLTFCQATSCDFVRRKRGGTLARPKSLELLGCLQR